MVTNASSRRGLKTLSSPSTIDRANGSHRSSVEVKTLTSKNPQTVKRIAGWLKANSAGGFDGLVIQPDRAMRMGLNVAFQTDLITAEEHARALADLACFQTDHRIAVDAIRKVCRAGMNARKRGELPAPASAPAAKAYATRRGRVQR